MEYTEEEKKAIEVVNNFHNYYNDESLLNEDELEENKINNNSIDLVLKLLDKQQKEIEKKNKIITEVERYARGIKDEELLLILKKDEIEKLVNECEELLGE